MAKLVENIEKRPIKSDDQLVVVHSQRFSWPQWNHLKDMREKTGCEVSEYIRRLVDADREKKGSKEVTSDQ
jgi:hypothetical protein